MPRTTDESQVLPLKRYLESLHPNIKFKFELEVDEAIPFLDILISRKDSHIVTGVYRKPTHSGVLTHYDSYVPFRYKLNMLNTLLDRGYKICSTWHTLAEEFSNLTKMLSNNGYNLDFIQYKIGGFLNRKHDPPLVGA